MWKQDVDLGYTLAPVKANSPKDHQANVSGPSFSPEDNEKLKALEELKNEKVISRPNDNLIDYRLLFNYYACPANFILNDQPHKRIQTFLFQIHIENGVRALLNFVSSQAK